MNPSEKGYFKRIGNIHSKNQTNYIRLFDAIDRQESYDEKALKEEFANEAFTKQFSVAKNYLYKLILKSLEAYHSDTESEINSLINQANILNRKALFLQSQKLLKKAKNLAYKHEQLQYVIPINRCLETVYIQICKLEEIEELFDQLIKEEFVIYKKLHNEGDYRRKTSKAYFLHMKVGYAAGNPTYMKMLEDLRADLMDEEDCLTIKSQFDFNRFYFLYYSMLLEPRQAVIHTNNMLALIEEYPDIAFKGYRRYVDIIYNHLISCLNIKDVQECERWVAKLKEIEKEVSEPLLSMRIFTYVQSVQFMMATTLDKVEEGDSYLKDFEKGIVEYESHISYQHKPPLFFLASYVHLIENNKQKALLWLEKALDVADFNFREDIISWVRIQELIIHFEMGNMLLLESKVRSAYRYLNKKERIHEVERLFMRFFRKLSNGVSSGDLNKMLLRLEEDTRRTIDENEAERSYFAHFDIIAWLRSKIEHKTLKQVLLERRSDIEEEVWSAY